ncbi:hypothetical protein FHR88_000519 [Bradyrhizobium betae]|uniref:Uncharacterized protein n=1 Tax=Bradyrhizobium betae TaxID=244734 RepID=A0A5P6NZH2_9BRAD|nr:hypothetical protein [Bradyrhizobium betae]QFI71218.1 hypothetical protein F8237_01810 [Bradyrhizobium betae]
MASVAHQTDDAGESVFVDEVTPGAIEPVDLHHHAKAIVLLWIVIIEVNVRLFRNVLPARPIVTREPIAATAR